MKRKKRTKDEVKHRQIKACRKKGRKLNFMFEVTNKRKSRFFRSYNVPPKLKRKRRRYKCCKKKYQRSIGQLKCKRQSLIHR